MGRTPDRQPAEPVWARLEHVRRADSPPLSLDRIVAAATRLADRDGLATVTMRRLAVELHAAPMALYRYVATKQDLLDLLVDAAYAEISLPERATSDWRADLRAVARATRAVVRTHLWLPALMLGPPCLGPHALAHREFCLAAVAGLGLDITSMMTVAGIVTGGVVSFAQNEAAEADLNQRSGTTEDERRAAAGAYVQRVVLESGRYPNLARWVVDGVDAEADHLFELSLDCLLDGIEARLLPVR